MKDTRISRIDLLINNSDALLKINCPNCQNSFTKKDLKKDNYQFIVNYENTSCFGTKEEYNKLEKTGEDYFLSLKVCRIEHKQCEFKEKRGGNHD